MPDHKITLNIGSTQVSPDDLVRAVVGKVTPQGKALTDILSSHEPELSAFLQDPKNREALARDPVKALSSVLPADVLKSLGQPASLPSQLLEKLQQLPFRSGTKVKSAALDLYTRAWAHISVSASNFAKFNADMNSTLRMIDPTATTPVVNEVIAAFDTVRGIHENPVVSAAYFSGQVQAALNEAQPLQVRWPR